MAALPIISLALVLLFSANFVRSDADSSEFWPVDSVSPTPAVALPPESISPSAEIADGSIPTPPPDLAPPSPYSANADPLSIPFSPSMSPAPAAGAQIASDATNEGGQSSSEGGMSGGKKAGIAAGVISGVFVAGLAGKIYKKRQDNIRRAHFGFR
ncbi:unnamed protein product [Cuscuta campestris]|uniref:Uncharacterized protein n=1 Tax=Cuscuta campestris TaxID=132261 RepID=A0A484MUL8_9ASTE|nr:unnamed protein product [Cuscuta campestris]